MVYVVLVIAIVLSTSGALFMKVFQKNYDTGIASVMKFVALSATVASFAFFCLNGCKLSFNWISILIGVAMGLFVALNTPAQITAYSLGNVSIPVVFSLLGGLIMPFVYGVIFLKEAVTATKIIGLILILVTILLLLPPKKEISKGGVKFLVINLLIFIFNGFFFTLMKLHSSVGSMTDNGLMCYVYGSMAIMSGAVYAVLKIKSKKSASKATQVCGEKLALELVDKTEISEATLPQQKIGMTVEKTGITVEKAGMKVETKQMLILILTIICYGLTNSMGNLCSLYCSQFLPASVQFPIVSGGAIIASTLASALIFKEKISLKILIMIVTAIASIILFVL